MDNKDEGIRVGAAKYGKGVFATRPFAVAETIGQVHGDIICEANYCSDYCIELFGDCSLEPSAPFRFVNHSCSPNCQFVQYDVEDEGEIVGAEVWLETLRPIAVDEQLTIDYAWPASGAILCGCESANCRGWIVAEDELDQLPLVKSGDCDPTDENQPSTLLDRTKLAIGQVELVSGLRSDEINGCCPLCTAAAQGCHTSKPQLRVTNDHPLHEFVGIDGR